MRISKKWVRGESKLEWRKEVHSRKLRNLYLSPNISRVMESSRMGHERCITAVEVAVVMVMVMVASAVIIRRRITVVIV